MGNPHRKKQCLFWEPVGCENVASTFFVSLRNVWCYRTIIYFALWWTMRFLKKWIENATVPFYEIFYLSKDVMKIYTENLKCKFIVLICPLLPILKSEALKKAFYKNLLHYKFYITNLFFRGFNTNYDGLQK